MNLKQMAVTAMLATAAVAPAVGAETDGYSLPSWGGLTIHFNRHPQEIYEITLTIHDAPGPLEPGGNHIVYSVPDVKCVPSHLLRTDGGIPFGFDTAAGDWLEWPNKKIDTVYKTYIAADLMVDEDYYGQGVCHWAIKELTFDVLRGNGTDPNQSYWYYDKFVIFTSAIQRDNIQSGKEVKTYFLKDEYNNPEKYAGGSGTPYSEEEYLKMPESERSKYFYTTLSAQKVAKPEPSLQHWIWLKYRRTDHK